MRMYRFGEGAMARNSVSKAASRVIKRYFPEREFILRTEGRVVYVRISRGIQFAVLVLIFGGIGWSAYSSFGLFASERVIEAKDESILNARLVYRNLLSDISQYQERFSSLTDELQKNHALVLGLVQTNSSLQKNLKSAESRLQSQRHEESNILAARAALKKKLTRIETDMQQMNKHNFNLRGNLSSITSNLENALAQRNDAQLKAGKLQKRIGNLESNIEQLHEAEIESVQRLTGRTQRNIKYVESVINRTGLNLKKLLTESTAGKGGQGGPFMAISALTDPADRLKAGLMNLDIIIDKWDAISQVFNAIPLSPPLDQYSISSHFGKRRDPMNRRWAMHYGLDMGGALRTSVYATAPGVVRYAKRKGKYGLLVEIEHGHGFRTRYGHLHKILVKRGQKVDYRTKIGLLGTSGRSTGSHVHYEIIHKKRSMNPWRFIKAGRYVFQRQ
jgi:murein DD-endopeptidase MepM/ murein hydrolase activator NlpD